MNNAILEARYWLLESYNYDEETIIRVLDMWLEDWLYKKEECPRCGND